MTEVKPNLAHFERRFQTCAAKTRANNPVQLGIHPLEAVLGVIAAPVCCGATNALQLA
ncbi:MAG: hypothetical protein AAFR35_12825 [Pseudomonadota bacterium]